MFALLLPHGWSAAWSTGVPQTALRRSPFMDTSVAGGTSPARPAPRGDATSATSFTATSKVVSTSRQADADAVAALAAVAASELEVAIRAARADQQKTSWQEHRPSRMRPAVIVEQEAHKRVVDTMAKGKTVLTSTSTALRAKATEAAEALAARDAATSRAQAAEEAAAAAAAAAEAAAAEAAEGAAQLGQKLAAAEARADDLQRRLEESEHDLVALQAVGRSHEAEVEELRAEAEELRARAGEEGEMRSRLEEAEGRREAEVAELQRIRGELQRLRRPRRVTPGRGSLHGDVAAALRELEEEADTARRRGGRDDALQSTVVELRLQLSEQRRWAAAEVAELRRQLKQPVPAAPRPAPRHMRTAPVEAQPEAPLTTPPRRRHSWWWRLFIRARRCPEPDGSATTGAVASPPSDMRTSSRALSGFV
mmetsp:Transcript_4806/g.15329  ORF Transcript_4806/g.15329 Transcript_4806/m.15329 type:complete len:425 (+) Transcript_4806:42-1316(+)